MRQTCFLLLLLLATSVPAAVPRFAAPGLRVTNLKASLAQDFTDHLAQQLVRRGLSVITNTDVQMVLGIERQRQLLGCSEDGSSCMTELTGALGADGVVMGTVVRVGKKFQVNVRIVDARDAKPLALYSEQCDQEEDLFGVLDLAAESLVNDLQPYLAARAGQDKTTSATPTKPAEPSAPLVRTGPGARRLWWIPTVTAGAFAIAAKKATDAPSSCVAPGSTCGRNGPVGGSCGWVLPGANVALPRGAPGGDGGVGGPGGRGGSGSGGPCITIVTVGGAFVDAGTTSVLMPGAGGTGGPFAAAGSSRARLDVP